MKIKLTRNTVADGKNVNAGEEVTVSDATGKTLIQLGKAVLLDKTAQPDKAAKGKEESPKPKEKGGVEDVLETDNDLGEGAGDLAGYSYEELCELAVDYKIENPNKIKKAKLIELINQAIAQEKAAA